MKTEKVQIDRSTKSKKLALSAGPKLHRETFTTSRDMDFFSEKELVTQTGHEIGEWPLVVLKETIDNSLDACEKADIAPVIEVVADAGGITVRDNGPGLPETTLKSQLDFSVRTSSREAYVSPTRGAQGNALKTLFPMPVIVDPQHGKLIVQAHGKRHAITCGCDPISQRAVIHDDAVVQPTVGTEIRMEWNPRTDEDGDAIWPFDGLAVSPSHRCYFTKRFISIVQGFAVFNPHATVLLDWFGKKMTWEATDTAWEKWKPNKPTSSHWYELKHLERQIGAKITADREAGKDRLVSDLIAEFDGLTTSAKRKMVLDEANLKRVKLSELVRDQQFDSDRIAALLSAMQNHSRPVKPARLGVIGEAHLKKSLLALGVKPESFRYKLKLDKDRLPSVLECAFGWLGDKAEDKRNIFVGANWSAALGNPFRSFGRTGEGLEAALNKRFVGSSEPIVYVLHLAHPRVQYTDRGKSALVIGGAA